MILYRAVNMSNELKRQAIIQDLLNMGVLDYKGKSVHELDYYEAKHALTMERIRQGQ